MKEVISSIEFASIIYLKIGEQKDDYSIFDLLGLSAKYTLSSVATTRIAFSIPQDGLHRIPKSPLHHRR